MAHGTRRAIGLRALGLCFALLVCAPRARAEEEAEPPRELPVEVQATLDDAEMAATGEVVAALRFTPLEDLKRPYSVRLRLMVRHKQVLVFDHTPKPPTRTWRQGQPVTYDVRIALPLQVEAGTPIRLYLGFHDADRDNDLRPAGNGAPIGRLRRIAEFKMPDLGPLEDPAAIDRVLAFASELAAQERKAAAWSALELGLRRATEDAVKYRFRDALVALGPFAPRPLSLVEEQVVAQRIEQERRRYLRQVSGGCFDREQYHGALRILEAIGGRLDEEADQAVIGSLREAKRTQRDILDLKVRILGRVSADDRAEVDKAVQGLRYSKALLDRAQDWLRRKRYAPAHAAAATLALNSPDRDLAHAATELKAEVEDAWLKDTPPAEAQVVQQALDHPAWARTRTSASHKFVFIGPEKLVGTIPERSRRRFDLSYVFLTDLFGRMPNAEGDRITVYFKELWNFGGGQGGGKKIDIGKADPEREGMRVDTGLLYHELTHCVDDTTPILQGWREGLANFGAAYSFEAIGQDGDSLHSFQSNLRAFREDYLARDLPYWRIQNYGPSAGFFLHFLEAHSKAGRRHDWKPYRQFFREYRRAPVRDGRVPYVARAAAYYLVRAFGPRVFDDLLAFRLPLLPDDREAVKLEMEAFASGLYALREAAEKLAAHPNSPVRRDLRTAGMMQAFRMGDREEARRISREELGIVHDWKAIGPFKKRGVHPGAAVWPPEREIDYKAEYPGEANVCRWRDPAEVGVVSIDATGWLSFNFNYQENTASYALTYLTVPEAVTGFLHVRADDDVTIFLNDRLVENYIRRGRNGSTLVGWRGPGAAVPDAMRLPVTLRQGRNKLLVKVRNRMGGAGFVLAVSKDDGLPIPGLTADTRAPPKTVEARARAPKDAWKSVLRMSFKSKSIGAKLETAVGKFKVANQVLRGQDKDKRVGWRNYTVRPGFPKDSPSNLLWLKARYTEGVDDLRFTLGLRPKGGGAPKMVITIMGNGGRDALSGWNLILHPRGKGQVGAQLERYDHIYYQVLPTALPKQEEHELELTLRDGRLTVRIGDAVLFDRVGLTPIPGRYRIGFSTYGPDLGIKRLELKKLKPAR